MSYPTSQPDARQDKTDLQLTTHLGSKGSGLLKQARALDQVPAPPPFLGIWLGYPFQAYYQASVSPHLEYSHEDG